MRLGYQWKRAGDGLAALFISKEMKARDSWTRRQLGQYQLQQLRSLVRHAKKSSPFYQEYLHNINPDELTSIAELPTLDKKTMMENFDSFLTDRSLKHDEIQSHLEGLTRDEYFRDQYRILSSSGSSGHTGKFVFNRSEWSVLLASVLRSAAYQDISPRLPNRVKSAWVLTHNIGHATARITASGDFGLYRLLRLDIMAPLESIVSDLNRFQPESLTTYASMGTLLANEQLNHRLNIRPKVVSVTSEVCTPKMAAKMEKAWGRRPFNSYNTSEGISGLTCPDFEGIHLFEDLAIIEIVDEENRPVPDGLPGSKLLMTNLYNHTQPLIRYEMSDMLTISAKNCPCGRPFRILQHIEGRTDEILRFEGTGEHPVDVHPVHFHDVLDGISGVRQFQVAQRDFELLIRLVADTPDKKEISETVSIRLELKLCKLGVRRLPVRIEFVSDIYRNPNQMGKLKMIIRETGNGSPI